MTGLAILIEEWRLEGDGEGWRIVADGRCADVAGCRHGHPIVMHGTVPQFQGCMHLPYVPYYFYRRSMRSAKDRMMEKERVLIKFQIPLPTKQGIML